MIALYSQERLNEIKKLEKNCLVNIYDNQIRSIMVQGRVEYRSEVAFPESTEQDMAEFEEDCATLGIHPAGSYNAIWRRFTKHIFPASETINGYFRDYFHGGWVNSFGLPKGDVNTYDINLAYGNAGYAEVPTDFVRAEGSLHPLGFYRVQGRFKTGRPYPYMDNRLDNLMRLNEVETYDVHDMKVIESYVPLRTFDLRRPMDMILQLKTHRKILKRYWGGWCSVMPLEIQHWKNGEMISTRNLYNHVNIPLAHLVTSKVRQQLWLKCASLGWTHCFQVQTDEVSTDLTMPTGTAMGEWKRKLPSDDELTNISAGYGTQREAI
jgi:hypothetical protein